MQPLPRANSEQEQFFHDWLQTFAALVRDVDYETAKPLFHPQVLAFGTHHDVIASLEQWVTSQWDNVWPKTTDFAFDLQQTSVLLADDASMATVISPWTSTGYQPDGEVFSRPGRATMIFHRHREQWICIHSHMSLNRGVPQQSYAKRAVKQH